MTRSRAIAIGLGALGVLVYVLWLGARDFWYPGEPDLAEICRAMFVSGDWIVPRRNGEMFLNYGPLFFWAGTLSSHLLGGIVRVRPPATQCARRNRHGGRNLPGGIALVRPPGGALGRSAAAGVLGVLLAGDRLSRGRALRTLHRSGDLHLRERGRPRMPAGHPAWRASPCWDWPSW